MPEPEVLDKLQKLEDELSVSSHKEMVIDWGKDYRKILDIVKLKNNLGIQMLIVELKRKEASCTQDLSEKKALDDDPTERKAIRRERLCWRYLLNLFSGVEVQLEEKEKQILGAEVVE